MIRGLPHGACGGGGFTGARGGGGCRGASTAPPQGHGRAEEEETQSRGQGFHDTPRLNRGGHGGAGGVPSAFLEPLSPPPPPSLSRASWTSEDWCPPCDPRGGPAILRVSNPPSSAANKQVCVPKIGVSFRAPSINFIFSLRTMWVRGWGGSTAAGQGPECPAAGECPVPTARVRRHWPVPHPQVIGDTPPPPWTPHPPAHPQAYVHLSGPAHLSELTAIAAGLTPAVDLILNTAILMESPVLQSELLGLLVVLLNQLHMPVVASASVGHLPKEKLALMTDAHLSGVVSTVVFLYTILHGVLYAGLHEDPTELLPCSLFALWVDVASALVPLGHTAMPKLVHGLVGVYGYIARNAVKKGKVRARPLLFWESRGLGQVVAEVSGCGFRCGRGGLGRTEGAPWTTMRAAAHNLCCRPFRQPQQQLAFSCCGRSLRCTVGAAWHPCRHLIASTCTRTCMCEGR